MAWYNKIFSGFKGEKALPPRQPGDNPQMATLLNRLAYSMRASPYKDFVASYKAEQYLQNVVVYRCVRKLASTVQSIPWRIEADPNVNIRVSKTLLQDYNTLINDPCDMFTGAGLRYWLALSLAMFGTAPIKVGVNMGKVNALYPLRPDLLGRKLDQFGYISGYNYGDTGTEINLDSRYYAYKDGVLKNEFCFETRYDDIFLSINEPIRPIKVLGLPVAIMFNLYQRALEMSDGTPNVQHILFAKSAQSAPAMGEVEKEIESRKIGGEGSDSGIMILSDIDLGHIALANGLENLHNKIPHDDMARQIAGIFGIPPALLNLTSQDGAKFANNYSESRLSFIEDTVIPEYLSPIEESLTKNICPPGTRLRFDRNNISAIIDKRMKLARELEDVSFLNDDEKREICGFRARVNKETVSE